MRTAVRPSKLKNQLFKISGTKTNVVVRVRPGIAEVERAKPSIGAVVPIAATYRESRFHNAVTFYLTVLLT